MMDDLHIRAARTGEIPELVSLVNRAYRGEGGWTNESHLIGGPRTGPKDVEELIRDPHGVVLTAWEGNVLVGCVYLKKEAPVLYLGMLSVLPAAQGAGIGKLLMASSMEYARQQGCSEIEITVITEREELIAWYERQGFRRTGEVRPFHAGDRFGTLKKPLELAVLEKEVLRAAR